MNKTIKTVNSIGKNVDFESLKKKQERMTQKSKKPLQEAYDKLIDEALITGETTKLEANPIFRNNFSRHADHFCQQSYKTIKNKAVKQAMTNNMLDVALLLTKLGYGQMQDSLDVNDPLFEKQMKFIHENQMFSGYTFTTLLHTFDIKKNFNAFKILTSYALKDESTRMNFYTRAIERCWQVIANDDIETMKEVLKLFPTDYRNIKLLGFVYQTMLNASNMTRIPMPEESEMFNLFIPDNCSVYDIYRALYKT